MATTCSWCDLYGGQHEQTGFCKRIEEQDRGPAGPATTLDLYLLTLWRGGKDNPAGHWL